MRSSAETGPEAEAQRGRAIGSILGLAAGDALGAGYEFATPDPDADIEMLGGGGFEWEPGEWTDDTQMALCVLEEVAAGSLEPAAIGERFLEWFRCDPTDVGNQTRAVLSAAATGADLSAQACEYYRRHPSNSAGNGSLMRTAPVALAHPGDPAAIAVSARAVSDLTHGDPMCGDACVLWSISIDHAIQTGTPDIRVGLGYLAADRRGQWEELIADAEDRLPSEFKSNGWVVEAFQAAWSVVARRGELVDPVRDGLTAAVRIGHDTDTVAAITGGLLGASFGASAVPPEWVEVLHGWPGYQAADLERLVESALALA